jgi:AraC family transcriptional regulator
MAGKTSPAMPLPTASPVRVDEVLRRSRAREERRNELGDGLSIVQWTNAFDRTSYHQPGHHTLSVYLEGGWETTLDGLPGQHGSPGCYCLLPAEHESHWHIGGPQRFVHLYWSGAAWAERVVRLLDAEPRALSLETRVFAHDPGLADWSRRVVAWDWSDPLQRLQAQELSHAVLDSLLLQAATPAQRGAAQRPKGGLSSSARRTVLAYVEAHLAGPTEALSLAALAALVHLSEFHFARMFRASMGCSVQDWIGGQRLQRAKTLLRRGRLGMAEVAGQCGYASASHLSHSIQRTQGVSPRQLRGLLRS